MRISRSAFLDPTRNGAYAVAAIALSIFVFAYSTRFGQVSILAYYAVWLPVLALDPSRIIGRLGDLALPGVFVLLLLASTFWSAAPATTVRASVQFGTHVACALAAARVVGFRSFTRGVLIGTLLVVLYSLLFGYSAYDAMDGSYTFVGAFTSKNQLGLYCSLGIFFGFVSYFTMREAYFVRIGALVLGILLTLVLNASHSATSIIALAAGLLVFSALTAILRFGAMLRAAVFMIVLPLVVIAAVGAVELGANEAILAFFGKDSTLTGRTYLWSEGLQAFHASPALGVGYMAYWVQGFPDAERLWAEFYITARTGFHFHNTVIETLVELGLTGTLLLALMFAVPLWRTVARLISDGDAIAACQLALLTILLVRAMSEVDVLFPYTIGSFLLGYLFIVSAKRGRYAAAPTDQGRTTFEMRVQPLATARVA